MALILSCSCNNTAQDKINGKGKRVFNRTAKLVGSQEVYRCTVCKAEKTTGKHRENREERTEEKKGKGKGKK